MLRADDTGKQIADGPGVYSTQAVGAPKEMSVSVSLPVPVPVPILHAGGFSWDEALVLVVAILAVPAISWFAGRMGKRASDDVPPRRRCRASEPTDDDVTTIE